MKVPASLEPLGFLVKPLAAIKRRLAAAPDTEGKQAVLRLVIIAGILFYYAGLVAPKNGWTTDEILVASGVSGFFVIAVGIFISICIRPQEDRLASDRRNAF